MEINVAFDTPHEQLMELQRRLNAFLVQEARDFVPGIELIPVEIDRVNRMRIQMYLEHRANFQDGGKKMQRRAKFYFYLKEQLEKMQITYRPITQQVRIAEMSDSVRAKFHQPTL